VFIRFQNTAVKPIYFAVLGKVRSSQILDVLYDWVVDRVIPKDEHEIGATKNLTALLAFLMKSTSYLYKVEPETLQRQQIKELDKLYTY